MLKSCDFTGRSCYVNRLRGRLENSESFSSARQACITRTPTAAPGLLGLRGEGQPRSPSVFAWTRRTFQKGAKTRSEMCHAARSLLKFNLSSLTRWKCVWLKPQELEGVAGGICRYWQIRVNAWPQPLGNSRVYKKKCVLSNQEQEDSAGLICCKDCLRSSHCV